MGAPEGGGMIDPTYLGDAEFQAGWWVMLCARIFGKRETVRGSVSGGEAIAYIWMGRMYIAKIVDMDAQKFAAKVGRKPTDDDLERVNCDKAGQVGHLSCGWCQKCDGPCFHCPCSVP